MTTAPITPRLQLFYSKDFYLLTIVYSVAKICRTMLMTYYKAYGLTVIPSKFLVYNSTGKWKLVTGNKFSFYFYRKDYSTILRSALGISVQGNFNSICLAIFLILIGIKSI